MKKVAYLSGIALLLLMAGCNYRLTKEGFSQTDPVCANQCGKNYSLCLEGAATTDFKTDGYAACRNQRDSCVNKCPSK